MGCPQTIGDQLRAIFIEHQTTGLGLTRGSQSSRTRRIQADAKVAANIRIIDPAGDQLRCHGGASGIQATRDPLLIAISVFRLVEASSGKRARRARPNPRPPIQSIYFSVGSVLKSRLPGPPIIFVHHNH
jgi:hypothetical protein